jgi:hypothetical protein
VGSEYKAGFAPRPRASHLSTQSRDVRFSAKYKCPVRKAGPVPERSEAVVVRGGGAGRGGGRGETDNLWARGGAPVGEKVLVSPARCSCMMLAMRSGQRRGP